MRRVFWLYWLATALCLSAAMSGNRDGIWAAIFLTGLQTIHWAIVDERSFPLQVRSVYLLLLLLGLWWPFAFLHVVQFAGTWALVLADYCFLARCLSLLSWNRREPLTPETVLHTFLQRPIKGSFVEHRAVPPAGRYAAGFRLAAAEKCEHGGLTQRAEP